ncbi:hypothetical protein [Sphingomonas immobilis]|uniref:DUF4142 domain-containing protein n=1 Tax=Sphingomonas immobilis TaxID=3063997 RepID=A0ABT9A695_9SPHN|nr:hypothetical protein [Sphingomonas sp. CA1-15]MDO7844506.1 hypothetical protein [Sphingomonas sp. CA1-15]
MLALAGQFSIPKPSVTVSVPTVRAPSISAPSVPSISLPVNVKPVTSTATTAATTTAPQLTLSERRDQLILGSQELLKSARAKLAATPVSAAPPAPGAAPDLRAALDAQIQTTATDYDFMARHSRSDAAGLEAAMDKSAKSNEALANILKKMSETSQTTTGNLK